MAAQVIPSVILPLISDLKQLRNGKDGSQIERKIQRKKDLEKPSQLLKQEKRQRTYLAMKRQADSGNQKNYFGVQLNFLGTNTQRRKMLGGRLNNLPFIEPTFKSSTFCFFFETPHF